MRTTSQGVTTSNGGPSSPGDNSSGHPKESATVVNVHWCEMNMVRSFIVSGSCGTRSPRCSIVWWSGRRPSISMNVGTDMTKNG